MQSGQGPSALVAGRDPTHLYATFAGGNSVAVYNVGNSGSLTPSGASVPSGIAPSAAAISPDVGDCS